MAKKEKSTKTQQGLPNGVKVAVAGTAIGVAAALFAGGCKNETNPDPKVCECPNGTFHDEGTSMPCCDGDDCECKVAYNVSLGTKQIRVEDTTGLANKADIEGALEWINTNLSGNNAIIHFKDMNTSPIMVIESTHNVRIDGSKFFIGIDAINTNIKDAIGDAIFYIYNTGSAPRMTKLSNKEINELGMQFDAAKNIIYISKAASQRQNQALRTQECQSPNLRSVVNEGCLGAAFGPRGSMS
jgi:hypothetical protein